MPTVYISDEANKSIDEARLFVAKMTGINIDLSQAVLYLHKAWKDATVKPSVYLTYPEKKAIFEKPEGAVEYNPRRNNEPD